MRIGMRAKIFFFTVIISLIFILFARLALIEIIPNKYRESKEEVIHNKISFIINSVQENSDNKKDEIIANIKKLKETVDFIEDIQILKNEDLDLSSFSFKSYGTYNIGYYNGNKFEKNQIVYSLNQIDMIIKIITNDISEEELKASMVLAFKLVSIFLFIFACIFSILISKLITNKANNINKLSRKMLEGDFDTILSKDIITDEFDDLVETINELTKEFGRNFRDLEREKLYKKQLMLSLSHEIKTPIGGLNGILEGMLDNIPPYTNRDKYIRECRKLSSRLGQIANEMLDVTKLDSVPTGREEVCVRIMVEEIVEGLSSIALSKGVEVIIDLDYRISIFTDERIFKRGITNIIENAIKYSNSNSNVMITSNGFKIDFYNECDSLTKEDLDFVFNPLYRGSNRKGVNGRGIGLYIVKECFIALNIPHKIENYKKGVLFRIDLKGEEKWD